MLNGHSHTPITWVLVANSKAAHIYHYGKNDRVIPLNASRRHPAFDSKAIHELMLVEDGTIKAESIDAYQMGHSNRGTTVNRNSSGHNTYEPQGDIRDEIKRRFVKAISLRLAQAHSAKSFDLLLLVAPAKLLGELKTQLTPAVQECVAAVLSKDLATHDTRDILDHLQDTLAEARVA